MWSSFDARRRDAERSIRRGWIAVIASIVFHGILVALPERDRKLEQAIGGAQQSPMSVVIVQAPTPAPLPQPPQVQPPELPKAPAPEPRPPRVAATSPRPAPAPPTPSAPPLPQMIPSPSAPPQPKAPPVDMAALIESRRSQRKSYEEEALAFAQRRDQGPLLPQSSAAAAIQRNLGSLAQGSEGTSGVFQILRKGERTAEFAFNGWKPDSSRRWRQVIEVDAGIGGDVELAIIRGMIKLIREHYTGDFNWQSYKQGKVIVLSARQEDSDALEDFLSREFFGTPVIKRTR